MANTKARVIGLIGSYELKTRQCQYATFAYYYDCGHHCTNALQVLCSSKKRIDSSNTIAAHHHMASSLHGPEETVLRLTTRTAKTGLDFRFVLRSKSKKATWPISSHLASHLVNNPHVEGYFMMHIIVFVAC